jgi:hypothetical protein
MLERAPPKLDDGLYAALQHEVGQPVSRDVGADELNRI